MNWSIGRETIKKFRNNPSARSLRENLVNLQQVRESPFLTMIKLMIEHGATDVLDVGANIGQFGIDLRRKGFKGDINSFEPVKETYNELCRNALRFEPWKAWNLALGEFESTAEINVSGNAGLSTSFLAMKKLHLDNFPTSAFMRTEMVQISTLNIQIPKLNIDPRGILLMLDVQCFEAAVLRGASDYLREIPLCFVEVSLEPLYESETLLLPLLNQLDTFGHHVIDVYKGLKGKSGQLLQLDILTKSQ